MLKARFHKFLMLLLLLAFTSQTMATAAMNCAREKMPSNPHATTMPEMDMSMDMMDMSAMAHMHHMGNNDLQPDQQPPDQQQFDQQHFDCCKTMGHCLLGGCSFATTSNNIIFLLTIINPSLEVFYLATAPTPLVSSLYRPPIFC